MIYSIGEFVFSTLPRPPNIDEKGNAITQTGVWTATSAIGLYAGSNCSDAASPADWSTITAIAITGDCQATDSTAVSAIARSCRLGFRLYCFGIDRAATLP
ncbi:MAG: hypothetical protein JNL83_07240 [Myxococcales bacterium]|nr:hypothetical protein [Myxococcales bacterium]